MSPFTLALSNFHLPEPVKNRPTKVSMEPRKCVWCNSIFTPVNHNGKTCCTNCSTEYHRKQERERKQRHKINAGNKEHGK